MLLPISTIPESAFDRQPLILSADTSLRGAIARIHSCGAACAIVMQVDRVVGYLCASDVVRWVATNLDLDAVTLAEVITPPTVMLHPTDAIDFTVLRQLKTVPYVPVVDDCLRGVIHVNAALRASFARFQHIVDSDKVGIFFAEHNGEIFDANDAFLAIVGYSRSDLQAGFLNWKAMMLPQYSAINQQMFQELERDRVSAAYEQEFLRRDGSCVRVLFGAALIDEEATKSGVAAFVLDISNQKQEAEHLKTLLAEKELLLKEVHHRVKNSLQVISSIFSLQAQHLDDPAMLSMLIESQNRVRSIVLIHQKLYQDDCVACIDFADYIASLVSDLFFSYKIYPEQIGLTLDLAPISLNSNLAISGGLLLNELVSNALKHAFPDGRAGEITIRSKVSCDRLFTLIVEDNGIGLPPGFDPQYTNSFGMRLVRMLIRQLQGKLTIESKKGAFFQIIFPLEK